MHKIPAFLLHCYKKWKKNRQDREKEYVNMVNGYIK